MDLASDADNSPRPNSGYDCLSDETTGGAVNHVSIGPLLVPTTSAVEGSDVSSQFHCACFNASSAERAAISKMRLSGSGETIRAWSRMYSPAISARQVCFT